jgi:hypothetical protein
VFLGTAFTVKCSWEITGCVYDWTDESIKSAVGTHSLTRI